MGNEAPTGPNSVPCMWPEDGAEDCGHLQCVVAELTRWVRLLVKELRKESRGE